MSGRGSGGLVFSVVVGRMPMKAYEEDCKDTLSLRVSLQSETSRNKEP